MALMTVQALLAANWPEGKCASAWSLRSRIVSSTTACWRCSASARVIFLGALGQEREVAPVGAQLGLLPDQAGAADDHPPPGVGRLGNLRLPFLGVILVCQSDSEI
jgi:hypothetical protein